MRFGRRYRPVAMKLTVQTFLSLDGVMQAPGGPDEDRSGGFALGGWQAPFDDEAIGAFVVDLTTRADAYLLGRRTFDLFRGHWPDFTSPDDPIATAINGLPKHVASRTLTPAEVTWRGEHPDTADLLTGDVVDAVRALKEQPGDELQVWGSADLLHTLLRHGLVDVFRTMTYPLLLGAGRRLFVDGGQPSELRPVDLTVTDRGVVIGTYEPSGPVRTGSM